MLLAECVILWCIVAWLLRVTITRRHAVDAWKVRLGLILYSQESCEYMCTVMPDLRCSTHGGSKLTELQMIQALAWNALGKTPLQVATLSGIQRNRQR